MNTALPRFLNDRPLRLAAATLVLAVAGGLALTAEAAPHGMGPGMAMMGSAGHMERLLEQVGASAEQRSQIQAIMAAARTDIKAQHEAGRGLHTQMMALFTQPTVDARAVETLRQQMLAQHDQASKRQVQALIEASRVLSVEQRKQLADQMSQRRATMERQRSERDTQDKAVTR